MLFAKYKDKIKKTNCFPLLYTLFLIVSVIHIYLSYKMSLGKLWYKYSGIGQVFYVTISIMVIYRLCTVLKGQKLDMFVSFIDPNTFSIFLYHILIMNVMQFVVYPHFNLSMKYQFVLTSIVVISVIFLYCFVKNKIRSRFISKANH